MKLLLDTSLLLWAAGQPGKLSEEAQQLIASTDNRLLFSPASLLKVAARRAAGRDDLRVDLRLLRRGLRDNGYDELPLTVDHALAADALPPLHPDPFDRLLIAQAAVEGIVLLTMNVTLAGYGAPVRVV